MFVSSQPDKDKENMNHTAIIVSYDVHQTHNDIREHHKNKQRHRRESQRVRDKGS